MQRPFSEVGILRRKSSALAYRLTGIVIGIAITTGVSLFTKKVLSAESQLGDLNRAIAFLSSSQRNSTVATAGHIHIHGTKQLLIGDQNANASDLPFKCNEFVRNYSRLSPVRSDLTVYAVGGCQSTGCDPNVPKFMLKGRTTKSQPLVFDCFLFHQELAMLYFRLQELDAVVDFFVIGEAALTFSGKRKRLVFKENQHLFTKFAAKILYVEITGGAVGSASLDERIAFTAEASQRNSLTQGLPKGLQENDIIMLHDLDEIPNPDHVNLLRGRPDYLHNEACVFPMELWYSSMKFQPFKQIWRHGGVISGKFYFRYRDKPFQALFQIGGETAHVGAVSFRDCLGGDPSCARGKLYIDYPHPCKGGWHLSYFLTEQGVRAKIGSFSHTNLNNNKTLEIVMRKRLSGGDIYDRTAAQAGQPKGFGEFRNGVYPKPKFYSLLECLLTDSKFDVSPWYS